MKENDISTTGTIKLDERSFTKEINTKKNCCGGKDTNQREIEAIFLGCDGVGKTTIIKALKGKNDYYNLAHTKKEYTEYLTYSKREHNIKVKLREINIDEFNNHYSENRTNQKYKFFFLVFDFYKKDTLYNLKNFINKIDRKYKIYIIGYNNDISENNITDFILGDEAEKFAKKYGCEYEYITLEEIYKVKAIIIENIGIYWTIAGDDENAAVDQANFASDFIRDTKGDKQFKYHFYFKLENEIIKQNSTLVNSLCEEIVPNYSDCGVFLTKSEYNSYFKDSDSQLTSIKNYILTIDNDNEIEEFKNNAKAQLFIKKSETETIGQRAYNIIKKKK